MLTVGPTGGGKTTLLYAALREINQLARSIQTVERPVEYILRGAAQYELSFIGDEAEALKGVLRGLMRNAPIVPSCWVRFATATWPTWPCSFR